MDAKAKGRLKRYLETKFNFRTAVSRVRRISQVLAHRNALESPMGLFTGETRIRLVGLAQKTGNRDFFMAYLRTGLSAEKRSLFRKSDELPKEFVRQLERLLTSIKTLDSSGRVVKPAKIDEAAIASSVENAFVAAHNIVQGFKITEEQCPGKEKCTDGLGLRSLAART